MKQVQNEQNKMIKVQYINLNFTNWNVFYWVNKIIDLEMGFYELYKGKDIL